MGSLGREEGEGGETAATEGPGADRRVEVKNAFDDGVHPTVACREEEDPGPGLGPEMVGRSILCAAAGHPGITTPPYRTLF